MSKPILLWLRRDLRLADHPALQAACAQGAPVIPVFLWDEGVEAMGPAPRLRLEQSLAKLSEALAVRGSRLILRRGGAAQTLAALARDTGAQAIYWSRLYDPQGRATGEAVKAIDGVETRSFPGHLLAEPWVVKTGQGGFYKVYTPFWKALRDQVSPDLGAPPSQIPAPDAWPSGDSLDDWDLGGGMRRGRAIVASHNRAGEAAASDRLTAFLEEDLHRYGAERDVPAAGATSDLSAALSLGEIAPQRIWAEAMRAWEQGTSGAEKFLKELVWRDFAQHLAFHTPHLITDNWRDGWQAFPWNRDVTGDVRAWMQGRTGVPLVDAGMRELHVTGRMHNRVRMVAASYLTKHLLTHWKVGADFFAAHLTDWDPASNAMGWQWVAGCGPDAAPYFRIFNPETQAEKFDANAAYRRRWIAEGQKDPGADALAFFDVVPERWRLAPDALYPSPIVDHKAARARALEAYEQMKS